jgi:hypothetical protein
MRRLLRVDGSHVDFDQPIPVKDFDRLLGCNMTDHVTLRHIGDELHVMFVDDAGYETEPVQHEWGVELKCTKARKPVNVEATKHYHANCVPGTTHQIVGHALIVPESDYVQDDGDQT